MFGDIHNTRCVDNDNLCILSVLKERKKAFPVADVSLIIRYAGIVLPVRWEDSTRARCFPVAVSLRTRVLPKWPAAQFTR